MKDNELFGCKLLLKKKFFTLNGIKRTFLVCNKLSFISMNYKTFLVEKGFKRSFSLSNEHVI
jgi:hypothetical protein